MNQYANTLRQLFEQNPLPPILPQDGPMQMPQSMAPQLAPILQQQPQVDYATELARAQGKLKRQGELENMFLQANPQAGAFGAAAQILGALLMKNRRDKLEGQTAELAGQHKAQQEQSWNSLLSGAATEDGGVDVQRLATAMMRVPEYREQGIKLMPDANPNGNSYANNLVYTQDGRVFQPSLNSSPGRYLDGVQAAQTKAPTTRTVTRGPTEFTEEFRDGKWVVVGSAPRTAPAADAGNKVMPQWALEAVNTANTNIRSIDKALQLLPKHGDTLGAQNAAPGSDLYYKYSNPQATELRGIIAKIGSMQIKDTSGATVTAAESQRLAPFIPLVTDPPGVVAQKLRAFKQEYNTMSREINDYFGGAGYRTPGTPAAATEPKPATAPATRPAGKYGSKF